MRRLTILGGPHDGEIVDYRGPQMRMPVLPVFGVSDFLPAADIPMVVDFREDIYEARQDFDGRWWYVRRET